MVLNHIAECPGLIVVAAAGSHAKAFGNGDLYMADVLEVPNGLENGVCEALDEEVLDSFFTEIVVNTVDLILPELGANNAVELVCGVEVPAERLFNNDFRG